MHGSRGVAGGLVAIVTAAFVAVPVAGAAPAADAAPRAEGPLLQQGDPICDRREIRSERATIGDLHVCLWWFAYLPVLETDVSRDHGALWLQATVTPRRGWCVRRVSGSLYSSPDVTRMHEFVVGNGGGEREPSLDVDAQGAALHEASLSQTLDRSTGKVAADPDLDEGSVGFTWTGRTAGRVEAVVGAEISWDSATGAIDVFEFGRFLNPVLGRC